MEGVLIALLGTVMSLLLTTVKNPASKAKVKAACLAAYRTIGLAFAGDPDFLAMATRHSKLKPRKK